MQRTQSQWWASLVCLMLVLMRLSPDAAAEAWSGSVLNMQMAPSQLQADERQVGVPLHLSETYSYTVYLPLVESPFVAPTVLLSPSSSVSFPTMWNNRPVLADSNSPAHWDGDMFYLINSSGGPYWSSGVDLFNLSPTSPADFDDVDDGGRWMEATYQAADGTLYGWYHYEQRDVCPGDRSREPRIGAAKSFNNGLDWQDLGIILTAPPGTLNCDTQNLYFGGGVGDFSVMLDPQEDYFYIFYDAYAGEASQQGVAVARLPFADRDAPVGQAVKWYEGAWDQPGLGGLNTPIFPVRVDWNDSSADAMWGPSIHWNTHVNAYVILLNHVVDGDWYQEGIYVTFNPRLDDPTQWTQPTELMDRQMLQDYDLLFWGGYYPQVIGTARGESDKLAGRTARFFISGKSVFEITFLKPGESALESSGQVEALPRPVTLARSDESVRDARRSVAQHYQPSREPDPGAAGPDAGP